jgi:DNA-binding transcriptional regulator YiaG
MARKKKKKKKKAKAKASTRGSNSRRGGRKPGKWEFVRPEEIKAFRTQQGLSRAKLATQLGVSTTSIQTWEAGRPASIKVQRQLRDLIEGRPPAGSVSASSDTAAAAAASGHSDASAIRTTGEIVAAYLQSQTTSLPPAELAKLVLSVRLALG